MHATALRLATTGTANANLCCPQHVANPVAGAGSWNQQVGIKGEQEALQPAP